MITVNILINGKAIFARTARNITKERGGALEDGSNFYLVDTGEVLYHHPKDKAINLAKKMLNTIKEP